MPQWIRGGTHFIDRDEAHRPRPTLVAVEVASKALARLRDTVTPAIHVLYRAPDQYWEMRYEVEAPRQIYLGDLGKQFEGIVWC